MNIYRRWISRFELKSNRWVYVPTGECASSGRAIKADLDKRWRTPENYFHLRPGGHVAALKAHAGAAFFGRLDISNFFGTITRNRVTRELKNFYPYKEAWRIANESTVRTPGGGGCITLPFGFIQSTILASVCLYGSRLGRAIRRLHQQAGLTVTVYVDDIVVSGPDADSVSNALADLENAADQAGFTLHADKRSGPVPLLTAFNIELSTSMLSLTQERLALFAAALREASDAQAGGILGYAASVNAPQAAMLAALVPPK